MNMYRTVLLPQPTNLPLTLYPHPHHEALFKSCCHLWVVFKPLFLGIWLSVYMPVSVPVCTSVGIYLDWEGLERK